MFAGACRTWEVAMDRWTVTVEEAAQILGISRSSAYECVGTGELRALRLGRWCRRGSALVVTASMAIPTGPRLPCGPREVRYWSARGNPLDGAVRHSGAQPAVNALAAKV